MNRVLSLGAGVQSTTVALMAATGAIDPIDRAVFADVGDEPAAVYEHLVWLTTELDAAGIPVDVVRQTRNQRTGHLSVDFLDRHHGRVRKAADANPPFFAGSDGMLRRQCTADYKVKPINEHLRRVYAIRPPYRADAIFVVDFDTFKDTHERQPSPEED